MPGVWRAPGGGLAQLGEHLLCKQGVIGSIPIVSTTCRRLSGVGWVLGVLRRRECVRASLACPCMGPPGGVCSPVFVSCGCGCMSWAGVGLSIVNQVLVRLWACRGQPV